MNKSWSVSYTYSNDGSRVSEVIHKSHDNGETIFEDGYSKVKDNELKEKFYKVKKNKDSKKTLLGKSKNQEEWQLLGDINGKKQYHKKQYVDLSKKFLDKPSTKHRLDSQKQKISKYNNELVNYDPTKEIDSLFKKMDLSMFDEDDFFKF